MLGKTLQNFASQLLSLLISIGDRFLLTAVLLRMWPTDLFADWTTLMAWSGLLGLADLGFVIFVGNRLQKAFGLGDEVGFQRQVGTAAFIYVLLGLLVIVIAALLAAIESASPFISVRSLNSSDAALALFSLGVMQAVQTTKSAFTQIYRGRGEFSRGVIIDSVSTLCIVVSALAAAGCGAGPRVLALTYIASQLVFAWGILLTDLRRRYPNLASLAVAAERFGIARGGARHALVRAHLCAADNLAAGARPAFERGWARWAHGRNIRPSSHAG